VKETVLVISNEICWQMCCTKSI